MGGDLAISGNYHVSGASSQTVGTSEPKTKEELLFEEYGYNPNMQFEEYEVTIGDAVGGLFSCGATGAIMGRVIASPLAILGGGTAALGLGAVLFGVLGAIIGCFAGPAEKSVQSCSDEADENNDGKVAQGEWIKYQKESGVDPRLFDDGDNMLSIEEQKAYVAFCEDSKKIEKYNELKSAYDYQVARYNEVMNDPNASQDEKRQHKKR